MMLYFIKKSFFKIVITIFYYFSECSNEILLEKERLTKEYDKVIKEEKILKDGSFSEKINVLFFGDLKYYTYGAIFLILIFIINKIIK
jgi:hypothetical protein